MITDNGKEIVAKYLLGQAPSFASHIAAGCGSRPLSTEDSVVISPTKKSLDFEVFRVPISSKGFIKEDGVEKIVFKAEMPTNQRFQLSEVGLFPAQSNALAGKYDSKLLVTFTPSETWSYVKNGSASAVPYLNEALDQDNVLSNISVSQSVVFINSDATIFNNSDRKNRQEPPRFLNRSLMVSGSTSMISENFTIDENSYSIENSSLSFDLSQNLPTDQIKFALSLVSKTATTNSNPDNVRIVLEFINNISNSNAESPKAVGRFDLPSSSFISGGETNRYITVSKNISDFIKDDTFSFANINLIKLYVSVLSSDVPTNNYFVILDGIRIDNISTPNPLYSMIGYNLIVTEDGLPILKSENTNNYIEYRFGIGVDG
jgi:hypothetical protein